jgi:hypothetical protein
MTGVTPNTRPKRPPRLLLAEVFSPSDAEYRQLQRTGRKRTGERLITVRSRLRPICRYCALGPEGSVSPITALTR